MSSPVQEILHEGGVRGHLVPGHHSEGKSGGQDEADTVWTGEPWQRQAESALKVAEGLSLVGP